jgi:uncharacterized coiled-coil DUF342 family protein
MTEYTPTQRLMLDRYYELCDQRDKANEAVKPLQEELADVHKEIQRLEAHANDLKAQEEDIRGGAEWLELKSEIRRIADVMRFIPPRGTY